MSGLISRKFHAYIDYPVALGLIAMPLVLGFTGMAAGLSIATGIAALLLTLLTDHETGLIRVVPYRMHLAVDGAVGAVFLAAPFALGFSGLAMLYYIAIGVTVLAVVSLHRAEPAGVPAE